MVTSLRISYYTMGPEPLCGRIEQQKNPDPIMNSEFRFVDFSNQSDDFVLFICCCFFVKTI